MIEESAMQNIRQVLLNKEQQLEQLQKEIEALKFSIRILEQEELEPLKSKVLTISSSVPPKENGSRPDSTLIKQFP
jgi:hypothetical protein